MRIELNRMRSEAGYENGVKLPPFRDLTVYRDWPAVPRTGEYIEIDEAGETLSGTVHVVMWGDGGVPQVRFR